jgi:tetratricopeptide (TPR) repeat protein
VKSNTKPYAQLLNDARKLYDSQQYTAALEIYDSIIKEFPDKAEPRFLGGACSLALGDNMRALGYYLQASEIEPNNAEIYAWMGKSLYKAGYKNQAMVQYKKALALDEYNQAALSDLGLVYAEKCMDKEATTLFNKAVENNVSNEVILGNLALVLARQGDYNNAVTYAKKAVRRDPKNSEVHLGLGNVYLMYGNITEAIQCYYKAIDLNKFNGPAYYAIALAKKVTKDDKDLIRRMETILSQSMPTNERKFILFALGKAYDDLKDPEKAFSYIEKGNMLVHSPYDPKLHTRNIKRTIKLYNNSYFQSKVYHFDKRHTPIFIVGMPRSGSTLVDQILSSHSKVHSIGESRAMIDVLNEIRNNNKSTPNFPDFLQDLTKEDIEYYRDEYLEQTGSGAEGATHVVDKNLFNFMALGFIATLFPEARIIHTKRHPLDSSFSCYMTNFVFSETAWTHNLEYIGKYYQDYVDIMNHWHKNLPIPILDVQYENMIANPEDNARRIIEFCNLEWEDECLEFYKTKRGINTASIWQVRQPIYKTAMQRWVPYAKHLQPLILALGDVLEDDYEQIESLGLKHGPRHNSIHERLSRLFS